MRNIIDMYPDYFINKTNIEVLKGEQLQLDDEEKAIEMLSKEFFIDSAEHSLPHWCSFVGIDYDDSLPVEVVRSNIKARLKAKDVTTVAVIKSIAETYSNGQCEVIENYNDYSFVVKFISQIGVPSRISEIEKQIEALKPAHLAFEFEFKYRTWGQILDMSKSWRYYKEKSHSWRDIKEKGVL